MGRGCASGQQPKKGLTGRFARDRSLHKPSHVPFFVNSLRRIPLPNDHAPPEALARGGCIFCKAGGREIVTHSRYQNPIET